MTPRATRRGSAAGLDVAVWTTDGQAWSRIDSTGTPLASTRADLGFATDATGLGSGIVMTIGADTASVRGRSQFLGGWRLCGDLGVSGGPLLVGAVAAVASLATASVVVGVLALGGTVWVGYWTARLDRARAVSR